MVQGALANGMKAQAWEHGDAPSSRDLEPSVIFDVPPNAFVNSFRHELSKHPLGCVRLEGQLRDRYFTG